MHRIIVRGFRERRSDEMKHRTAPVESGCDVRAIAEVALEDLNRLRLPEVSPIPSSIEDANGRALMDESVDEVASQEASPPEDEDWSD